MLTAGFLAMSYLDLGIYKNWLDNKFKLFGTCKLHTCTRVHAWHVSAYLQLGWPASAWPQQLSPISCNLCPSPVFWRY